jgi:hypothetical protein
MEVRYMMVSATVKHTHHGGPLNRRSNDGVEERAIEDSFEGAIPLRYRDGHGGIDLEKLRRDQLQARRQAVRAIVRRLKKQLLRIRS